MINRIDYDEFKITEKEIYITTKDGKSSLKNFRDNKSLLNLSDLIEIDNLPNSERALETVILDKMSSLLAGVDITTQEDILKYDPIGINGFKANSLNNECIGIALDDVSTGSTKKFLTSGSVQNLSWTFTAGLPVYLNGNSLSHVEPSTGFVQRIGLAKHATILFIKISEPIYKS